MVRRNNGKKKKKGGKVSAGIARPEALSHKDGGTILTAVANPVHGMYRGP